MCAASIRLLYTCLIVYVDMYNIKESYVHALLVLNDCSETHAILKTGIVQYLQVKKNVITWLASLMWVSPSYSISLWLIVT